MSPLARVVAGRGSGLGLQVVVVDDVESDGARRDQEESRGSTYGERLSAE
jgi:hypothetical protein